MLESASPVVLLRLTTGRSRSVFEGSLFMISSNDFRPGVTIQYNNGVWQVVESMHVKPGKGAAFVRTKLKNVETGNVLDATFRAGEKVPPAVIEKDQMQFL